MAGFEQEVVYARNIDLSGGFPVSGQMQTNGQLLIASTALNSGNTHINVGNIIAADSSITIGYSSPNITIKANNAFVAETISGNDSVPLSPTLGNWNILTANSTPKFLGSGSTLTLDFGLSNLVLGSSLPSLTTGTNNVGVGNLCFNGIIDGQQNVAFGSSAGKSLTNGSVNSFLGYLSGFSCTTGTTNTGCGYSTLVLLTTSQQNTACGASTLSNLINGFRNTALGASAGNSYTSNESDNINIWHIGVTGESHTIRIGLNGSSSGQQNRAFLAGITGVTVAASAPIAIDSNSQLSSLGFGTTGQVLTSTGAGSSPTWQANSSLSWVVVTGASQAMSVNTGYIANNAGTIAFTLPTTSAVGDIIEVTGINNATGWSIAWTTNQQIFFGTATTTVTTGSIASSSTRDSVRFVCVIANLTWNVISSVGNISCI